MKYIGLIKTDDLPSTSIGLRVSEMAKLGFSTIILYAKARTTMARQFRNGIVVSDDKKLRDEVAKHGDCIVMIAARHIVDASSVRALGEPKENECRCLAGQRLVGCVSEGDRNVVKVFEYDRRKGVARFGRGDSGDVQIDIPGDKGLMVMRSAGFLKMLEQGDSFISAGCDFQKIADAVGISLTCADPISAGVAWHSVMIHDEKKPVNIVYGEKYLKDKTAQHRIPQETGNEDMPILTNPILPLDTPPLEDNGIKGSIIPNAATAEDELHGKRPDCTPVLSVVFQTHNRTATACYCLDSLCKRLRYSGRIHYCICDDRSERGHVAALIKTLSMNGISDYSVHVATESRWGLGASLNNGLQWSFKFTDCVLTTEDDFFLRKEFDITEYVAELMKPDVAGIKLAANTERFNPVVKCNHTGFRKVTANRGIPRQQWYTFNNLVMLRHRRVFDEIGYYVENRSPETMETDAIVRFNTRTDAGEDDSLKVLWPDRLRLNTYNTEWFVHIGKSTLGHNSGTETQRGYEWLNDSSFNHKIRLDGSKYMSRAIHIVVPCYNNPELLDRCLSSIASQTQANNLFVTVVDDMSKPETSLKIVDTVARYPFAMLMPLHEKGMAGGARNHAILYSPVEAPYTMFMDSDDEFSSPEAIAVVLNGLHKAGTPDVLCFGYIDSYNRKHQQHATSENMDMFIAPWSRCTATAKVQLFTPGRRMCNDTMQYLRTVDTADTVATIPEAIVRYHSDNPESGWHSMKVLKSKEAMDAMALVINDIVSEKFKRKITYGKIPKVVAFIKKAYDSCLREYLKKAEDEIHNRN